MYDVPQWVIDEVVGNLQVKFSSSEHISEYNDDNYRQIIVDELVKIYPVLSNSKHELLEDSSKYNLVEHIDMLSRL